MTELDLVNDCGFDESKFTYLDQDNLVRDMRDYTSRLDLSSESNQHKTANESVLELLRLTHETTNRDLKVSPSSSVSPPTPPITASPIRFPHSSGGLTSSASRGITDAPGSAAPHARTSRELRCLAYYTKIVFPDVAHRDASANLSNIHMRQPASKPTVVRRRRTSRSSPTPSRRPWICRKPRNGKRHLRWK